MAIVTPTADDICTEGFRRVAGRVPTSQELDRMLKFWLEEVLAEIWQTATRDDTVRFKSLENSATLVLRGGQRKYDWPDDFHRPIAITLYEPEYTGIVGDGDDIEAGGQASLVPYGFTTTGAADGGNYLMHRYDADLVTAIMGGSTATPWYGFSGKKIVMTERYNEVTPPLVWISGPGTGLMREILHTVEFLGQSGTLWIHILDDLWESPNVPVPGDPFVILSATRFWQTEEMRGQFDEEMLRDGVGVPCRFNNFDHTLEFDVASDRHATVSGDQHEYLVAELRYWSNILKINKDSDVMQRILTNWRVPLVKGIAKITAQSLDDARYTQFREDFAAALVALVNQEWDYGVGFEGFRLG